MSALVQSQPQEVIPLVPTPVAKPAPHTLELLPHQSEVLSVQFSPSGRTIASCSADKLIKLTAVYGENHPLLTLKGHKGAVLEFRWAPDGDRIMSVSSDRDAAVWDLTTGQRIKRLTGHEDIVNACAVGRNTPNVMVTGSDDGSTKVWDLRVMRSVVSFPERYQVLSVAYDDAVHRVFAGSLDSKIRVFDVRKVVTSPPKRDDAAMVDDQPALLMVLNGHVNAITGIALSSTNSHLVSNSMDQSVKLWDVRPFCAKGEDGRCFATMRGPTHNFEQTLHRVRWSPDDMTIGVGSADRHAYVFLVEGVEAGEETPKLLYRLPGHIGAVTEICFHPTERVIASSGTDKKVFLKRLG